MIDDVANIQISDGATMCELHQPHLLPVRPLGSGRGADVDVLWIGLRWWPIVKHPVGPALVFFDSSLPNLNFVPISSTAMAAEKVGTGMPATWTPESKLPSALTISGPSS
jgi:hypothetical protein